MSVGYLATSYTYNPGTGVFSAPTHVATASVGASGSQGAFAYGTLNYTDSDIMGSWSSSVNSYNQLLLQNTNSGTSASTNFVVSNNLATNSTNYAELGINSSGFSGSGVFGQASMSYLGAQSVDLAIGTYGSNPIHFVINSSATDAMTIKSTNAVTIQAPLVVGSGATGATGSIGAVAGTFAGSVQIGTGATGATGTITASVGIIVGLGATGATGSVNALSLGATGVVTNTLTVGTLSGLLKATTGVVSAATSGTDYAPATSGSSILYGNGAGGFSNVTVSTGLSFSAGTLSATSSGATVTNDTSSAGPYYPVMSSASSGTLSTAYISSTKLYFNPSSGTINATIFNSLSDANKKQNVAPIQDAAATVNRLNGVSFEWKDNGLPSYGVIAQEIEEVLPELVNTSEDGVKSVNYNGIIGFLINAIKEQQKQINKLKDNK